MGMLIMLILGFLVICLAWAYWPIAIVLIILWVAVSVWKAKIGEEQKSLDKARLLNNTLPKYLGFVTDGKTERTRLNNVEQVISNLSEIIALDPKGKVAPNAAELMVTMKACRKTIPTEIALAKAEKAVFKNQRKAAMNAYLDALFSIKKLGTTDADFAQARVVTASRKPLTVDDIIASAIEMGWDGEIRT